MRLYARDLHQRVSQPQQAQNTTGPLSRNCNVRIEKTLLQRLASPRTGKPKPRLRQLGLL
jgi:hypothetical protein